MTATAKLRILSVRLHRETDWGMIGVWAEAKVQLTGDTCQRIRSAGLWGIESVAYIKQEEQIQLAELRRELTAIGFAKRQIDQAFAAV